MNCTIINDCRDANAAGRQTSRAAALLDGHCSFIGVTDDLEAAGNLIDTLDAYGDTAATILVNVAPRDGHAKKWENGTPFGYFTYKNILVVTTIDGLTMSLVKKLQLTDTYHLLDIYTATTILAEHGLLHADEAKHLTVTQFRSFDFSPRIAAALKQHIDLQTVETDISSVTDAPTAIWWIDNFGNCKTTLTKEDVVTDAPIDTAWGTFPYYQQLKDVPDNETAIITGSSGLGNNRWLELVTQGASTAAKLSVSSGDNLL